MKKNSFGRQLLLYVVLFGVIIVMLSSLFYKDTQGTTIETYSELAGYIQRNEVKEVYVHNTGNVTVTLNDDSQKSYKLAYVDMFYGDFQDTLLANGVKVEYQPPATMPWWVSLLPTLFIIILFVVIYFIAFKKMGSAGGKFNSLAKHVSRRLKWMTAKRFCSAT